VGDRPYKFVLQYSKLLVSRFKCGAAAEQSILLNPQLAAPTLMSKSLSTKRKHLLAFGSLPIQTTPGSNIEVGDRSPQNVCFAI